MKVLDIFKQDYEKIYKCIDDQDINSYMNFIVEQLFAANKYFNDEEPWKKKSDILRLNTIIYVALELIRKITIMLYPVIPSSSLKVLNIFDIKENDINFVSIQNHETLQKGAKINKINILFNKIEKND